MGPGVANECVETLDGPTIWEDHFYPEVIDPQTGQVLPEGARRASPRPVGGVERSLGKAKRVLDQRKNWGLPAE
jgi:hypothetical protein